MRVHLLAPPNGPVSKASLDGFCSLTGRFAALLKRQGHTVFLYAPEESAAECDELVTTVSAAERRDFSGAVPCQYVSSSTHQGLWVLSNLRAADAIRERKQSRDFICTIGGLPQREVADAHLDLQTVEYSVGYGASYAPFRVFESRAWQHHTYGAQGLSNRFYDDVIPNFFEAHEFDATQPREDFLLYVGRLTEQKGIAIACQVAQAAGIPLKVVGHGNTALVTHGAECIGEVSVAERNSLMARARALICPTQYVEPFGNVAAEAQLCGTPVISTNFGGFTESVIQGRTGFRCNYFGEFLRAVEDAKSLNHAEIRLLAEHRFSFDAVRPKYEAYFQRLQNLWGEGWYSK